LQVYGALSESTFFGLREFIILMHIINKFNSNMLKEKFWDTKRRQQLENYWDYFNECDFADYKEEIKKFLVSKNF